jgi:hypothetical protein
MKYILISSLIVLGACSSQQTEFFRTVEQQRADGYVWQQIECREVNPELPAITIDTPIGNKLVCNKLVKN